VTVREGKGDKDRITLLPEAIVAPLQQHLVCVKTEHERALQEGYGGVELPYALARKYPHADREWICGEKPRRSLLVIRTQTSLHGGTVTSRLATRCRGCDRCSARNSSITRAARESERGESLGLKWDEVAAVTGPVRVARE
jgi:hypothetical protein